MFTSHFMIQSHDTTETTDAAVKRPESPFFSFVLIVPDNFDIQFRIRFFQEMNRLAKIVVGQCCIFFRYSHV